MEFNFFSVDVLSYVAMKLSGFPPNRIIGIGTFLATCKFQYFVADKLSVSPSSIQALVIGENSSHAGRDISSLNKIQLFLFFFSSFSFPS